ncbi:hypothetical protein [Rhodococcus maanshanensis]|uniref:hypothetical protein n=1 Tax=Rhodococcus maanshanensis TaxID=183556 RepID=UPI001FEDCF0F|nr:hypothetical protein [Rhodococcus maanshanensis]
MRRLHEVSTAVHRTEPWQFKRVMAMIDLCAAHDFVREVFEHHRGAHRVFTADAFLAAYIVTPMLGIAMHQTNVTAVVRGWTASQRRALGISPHADIKYKSVNDALRRLTWACRSSRYPEWDERAFAQALLDASLWRWPPTGAIALDSTDVSTWGRVRYRKPLVDADPDGVPPPNHPLAPPDPEHPHARRRGHHLPNAPVGRDKRYRYTVDPDARMGWRSPEFEETPCFCGFDLHVITDVPSAPGRAPAVHIVRALNLTAAGSHKGIGGLAAVQALGESIPDPHELIADRAYNNVRNDTFAIPVWERGYTTIYDLHANQRGMHPGPEGTHTIWIDGVLYPDSLPEGLYDLDPIETDMSDDERERLERRHQARQAYAYVPHDARHPDGTRRYRGPAVQPARVRCPNNPVSMRGSLSLPTTSCTRGEQCGCGRTITLRDTDYPDLRMPVQHGTLAWEASYHRRVGIESLFADLKQNRLHVHRGYFRGFGISRYTLLLGFTLAALNLLILHDWHFKRELLDPLGRYLGEPEPEHTPQRRLRRIASGHPEKSSATTESGR